MAEKMIVQILHGMKEHTARYQDFISFLEENGIHVLAQNHIGHGPEAMAKGDLGYFEGDWFYLVNKQIELMEQTQLEHPEAKYILLGHSMGSFAARTLAAKASDKLDGLIIMGTAQMPSIVPQMGFGLARIIERMKGDRYPSKLLDKMALGDYNKKFETHSGVEWLSRDTKIQEQYLADPLCNYPPSVSMYKGIFQGLAYVTREENINAIAHNLPILLISGAEDPVGKDGEGVRHLYEIMQKLGFTDIDIKLYLDMRHEILNELGKEEVYQDLLNWLMKL